MSWFLLGALLLALALLAARAVLRADPRRLARALRWAGAGLLGLLALLCLIAGRPPLAVPLGMAALMLLGRSPSFLGGFGGLGGRGPGRARPGGARGQTRSAGQVSEIETAWLRMRLDHDSGEIAGEVLRGRFTGRRLADLTPAELVELWRETGSDDPQSARLVEAYLDRHRGPDWRAAAGEAEAGKGGGAQTAEGAMTQAEAYEVLGLAPGAEPEEIQAAYRRLMRHLHPDQGGSTWLAAKINAARDLLLGGAQRR